MSELSAINSALDGTSDLSAVFGGDSLQLLTGFVLAHLSSLFLIAARLAGLVVAGPVCGQSLIPWKLRVGFVALGSLVLLPIVSNPSQAQPMTFDFAIGLTGEFVTGLVLGVGILVILWGLRQAGQLIDQQSGLALGELFDPNDSQLGSPSVRLVFLSGICMFLLIEPLNGHLVVTSALLDTFKSIPIGQAFEHIQPVEIAKTAVSQSLLLAVQIVAPTLAILSFITLVLGAVNRANPNLNVYATAISIRVLSCLFVLATVFSGIGETISRNVPDAIDRIVAAASQ